MGSSQIDFDRMRTAERKRRSRQLRNLESALHSHSPISSKKATVLWTPPKRNLEFHP